MGTTATGRGIVGLSLGDDPDASGGLDLGVEVEEALVAVFTVVGLKIM